jgi:hypothetical protein
MRRAAITTVVALLLTGCAGRPNVTTPLPLGRSIAAGPPRPAPVAATPTPVGDPPAERGGTIPAAASVA